MGTGCVENKVVVILDLVQSVGGAMEKRPMEEGRKLKKSNMSIISHKV